VCSDHFSKVIVLDPEDYIHRPEAAQPWSTAAVRTVSIEGGSYNTLAHERSRVYQFTALHIYYVITLRVLRRLFPTTFNAEAQRFGVLIRRFGFNCRLSGWGFRQPYAEYARRGEAYPDTLYGSRRAIEGMVRALVKTSCQTAQWVHGTATELKLASDGSVCAVAYRIADGTVVEIDCDMVVGECGVSGATISADQIQDCTGNTQAGLKLLERALPSEDVKHIAAIRKSYDPKMFYVTHEFPKPPGFDDALKGIDVGYGIAGESFTTRRDVVPHLAKDRSTGTHDKLIVTLMHGSYRALFHWQSLLRLTAGQVPPRPCRRQPHHHSWPSGRRSSGDCCRRLGRRTASDAEPGHP